MTTQLSLPRASLFLATDNLTLMNAIVSPISYSHIILPRAFATSCACVHVHVRVRACVFVYLGSWET